MAPAVCYAPLGAALLPAQLAIAFADFGGTACTSTDGIKTAVSCQCASIWQADGPNRKVSKLIFYKAVKTVLLLKPDGLKRIIVWHGVPIVLFFD